MAPTIELIAVSKAFPGVQALAEVDLALHPGRIHALVGENGAGKSTLIHILGGSLRPDQGSILLAGEPIHFRNAHTARRHGIVTVYQEVDLFPDLTVAENIALEQGLPGQRCGWIGRRDQEQRCRLALERMGSPLAPETLAGSLTPAQRQMVLLGAALTQDARVVILDEPTSSLSAGEAEVLFEQLLQARERGLAILYVSHRFEEVFALADEVTVLRDGRRVWHGPLAETSAERLIERMVGREIDLTERPPPRIPGEVRLCCRDLSAADGSFREVSLEVRGGQIVGLYGLVGAGRSEWAQGLLGLRPLAAGQVWVNGQRVRPAGPGPMADRGLAYVPEDRMHQGLCRELSVRSNYVLASLRQLAVALWLGKGEESRRTRQAVKGLSIRLQSIEQAVGTLSGGNQQKVVVGRWLERQPTVLILDEPTRGIDVAAKAEMHTLIHRLAAEGRAVVLISSDLAEVLSQSDQIGVFRAGRLVEVFEARSATPEQVAAAAMPRTDAPLAPRGRGVGGEGLSSPFSPLGRGVGGEGLSPPPANVIPEMESPTPHPQPLSPAGRGEKKAVPWREAALVGLIVLLFALLQWRTGRFLQAGNVQNLAADTALLGFCALGAFLVLLVGGIDISLGSIMAFTAAVAGTLWERQLALPLVVGAAGLLGGLLGLGNAAVTLLGRVHPIVVTLGTLSLYRGLTQWWLEQDVQIPGSFRQGLIHLWLGLPLLAWLGLGLALLLGLWLSRSVVGRHFYALGSNPTAARRAGISRARIWLIAFTLQGMLAGLAGLLYLARSGSLQPVSYEDKTLEAIGAAVVGGVAITGGRGSVLGVLLGCLFLVSLAPACQFLDIPTTWRRTLVGVVTVAAVLIDSLWRGRQG